MRKFTLKLSAALVGLVVMPGFAATTQRIVRVKSSGGDYTSLAAAILAESKNLVSLDQQLTIECYSSAAPDTNQVLINATDGWVTDSNHYIRIVVPPGERHTGKFDPSKYYRVMNMHEQGLYVSVPFTRIEGLQFYVSQQNYLPEYPLQLNGCTNCLIDGVLIDAWYAGTSATQGRHAIHMPGDGGSIVRNTIIYGRFDAGIGAYWQPVTIENVTIIATGLYGNGTYGIDYGNTPPGGTVQNGVPGHVITNVYCAGAAMACFNGPPAYATITTSATSDGTGTITNLSPDNAQLNSDAGPMIDANLQAGSPLRGAGTDLSGQFTTDCASLPRLGLWDIGACAYRPGGPAPSVSITAPAGNTAVSGTIPVTATASDGTGVELVQFQLDDSSLGPALPTAPYTFFWDTTSVSNGSHALTAIAVDTIHNATISTPVAVTLNNALLAPPKQGLIGYWNFDEGTGVVAHDISGNGYDGIIGSAAWTAGDINSALNFNGTTSSVVTPNIPLSNAFSISAWVNPAITGEKGYVRIAETRYNRGLYLGTDATGTKYKFIGGTGGSTVCGASYGCAEGGTIVSGWHLVTGTFDGAMAKLYVDGVLVASDSFSPPPNTAFPLFIGAYFGGSGFGWNGTIDEVRLYNRAITSSEVAAIYKYVGVPKDATPPTTPANVSASAISSSQINVSWTASTDNVAVTGYHVFRNGTPVGATTSALSYSDTGLTPLTTYSYTVSAFDPSGNTSNPSAPSMATTFSSDVTPPTVSIAAPTGGAIVSGTITVSANASDAGGVASVQFQLDGKNLGPSLTTKPYSMSWDTTTVSNGSHTFAAIAQDTSNNTATSALITFAVSNSFLPTQGLIGYWNFDEGTGGVAHDSSGNGYDGTISSATWTTGNVNSALSFNGTTSNVVTPNIPVSNAFSISAWVNPAVTPQRAYVRIAETRYNAGIYLGTDVTGTKYKLVVNAANGTTGVCGSAYGCAEGGAVASGWHLVSGTFDGASAKLYVDGVLVASDSFSAPPNAAFPLFIGAYFGGSGFGWNGAIDELRLYNRALTSTEVQSIYGD